MYKNVLEIDVFRCVFALIKKYRLILVIAFLFFAIGAGMSLGSSEDLYSATATVYASADSSYTDAANAVTAMNAYMDIAKSYRVCQRAALIMGRGDIDASDIQESVYINTSAKTSPSSSTITNFMNSSATIISFIATSKDADVCMEMADAMAQSYTREMADILHTDSVKILDTAYSSYKSYDYKIEIVKNGIKAMLIGFAFACIVIVACEIFDPKVRTIREATIRDSIPVIGVIPDYKE